MVSPSAFCAAVHPFRGMMRVSLWLFVLLIAACAPKTRQNPIQSVWQSARAKPEDCVAAVNKFIPPGTKLMEVKQLVGSLGELVHSHGPSIAYYKEHGESIADGPYVDKWNLLYNVKGKLVVLMFTPSTGSPQSELLFVRAVLGTEGVPNSGTNRNR